jgi:hypothetical protein
MRPIRHLLSIAFVLVSVAARADAHDPGNDVPRVENAGTAKALGITTVDCEAPTGTPRVARCTFVYVSLSERGNHSCTLSARTSILNMTQVDANTWRNDWPASGPCKQSSSTLLVRSKKSHNKWTIKDTHTAPRVAADAPKETHALCDEHVGTQVEIADADAHHPRKVDCESFDL